MPKRKRSSPSPSQSLDPVARQKKLCTQRLTTALKPLLAALRLAAGFERQKHGRRKKTAQAKTDAAALDRLDTEYAILKTLDLEKVASQHLRKTVGRVKTLKEAEALQEYIGGGGGEKGYEGRSLAKDPATLNVTARLYKVDAVRKVVDAVIADLKAIVAEAGGVKMGGDTQKTSGEKEERLRTNQGEDENMLDAGEDVEDPYMAFSARIAAPSSGEDDSEASISGDDRPLSIGDSDTAHDPEADLDAASSDDEATSLHRGTSEEAEATQPSPSPDHNKQFISISASVSSFDSDADSDDDTPITRPPQKSERPITSAFLPALSHANYISGSESASDLDDDERIAPRKNRRGQRARQKIAEQKFGAAAKHLEKTQRNAGWDAKRGAVDVRARQRGGDGRDRKSGRGGGRGPEQSGGNAEPLGQKAGTGPKRDDKGALHPSWEAAKKAKEAKKLKIEIGGMAQVGKRVVFD